MSASPYDSAMFGNLYGTSALRAVFSDEALIRRMIEVERHLAMVQGELGIIPQCSAKQLDAALAGVTIVPSALSEGTATDGVPVPALVRHLRDALGTELGPFVHWGATSQDILDTAYVLMFRDGLDLIAADMRALLGTFAGHAKAYSTMPMAARTRHQVATATSFGARVAIWGGPFLRHIERLEDIRRRMEMVSLAGASGTLSAMGDEGPAMSDALARSLSLAPARLPWHASRDTFVELGTFLSLIAGSAGKFAEDILMLGQSELREVMLANSGGSSTMPHKSNPTDAEAIVTLSRFSAPLAQALQGAMSHKGERDGAAWGLEWHCLPQLFMAAGGALHSAVRLANGMKPDEEAMRDTIDATNGLMFAEAATFALAAHMPRDAAQNLVKTACASVSDKLDLKAALQDQTAAPVNWDKVFDPLTNLGQAPVFAQRFAEDCATVLGTK